MITLICFHITLLETRMRKNILKVDVWKCPQIHIYKDQWWAIESWKDFNSKITHSFQCSVYSSLINKLRADCTLCNFIGAVVYLLGTTRGQTESKARLLKTHTIYINFIFSFPVIHSNPHWHVWTQIRKYVNKMWAERCFTFLLFCWFYPKIVDLSSLTKYLLNNA